MLVSATIHKLTHSSVRFVDRGDVVLWLETERGTINLTLDPEVAERIRDHLSTGLGQRVSLTDLGAEVLGERAVGAPGTRPAPPPGGPEKWQASRCRSCFEPFDGDTMFDGECDECQDYSRAREELGA